MTRDAIALRLAGLSALAGAALRVAAAFPSLRIPLLPPESLYFLVDLLLSLALVGLLAVVGRFRTWLGLVGFVGALAGFELVRTGDRLAGGGYQRGAAVLGVALAVAGLALLGGKGATRLMGAAWLASFAVGAVGQMMAWPVAFTAASLLFCAGFGLGGVVMLQGGDRR
jgi:hypothetical protein